MSDERADSTDADARQNMIIVTTRAGRPDTIRLASRLAFTIEGYHYLNSPERKNG